MLRPNKQSLYWDINQIAKGFPKITGFPLLTFEEFRPYTIKTANGYRQMVKVAPKKNYLKKLINYPYHRWGAPQIKIIGGKGGGKSNLLNFITALQAAKGLQILTFNDQRLEIRSLAAHGYFDKSGDFHPFQIDIFVPKGYEFKRVEKYYLWDYYPNVKLKYYTHTDQILKAMKNHKIVVVYEECFTPSAILRLWNTLMEHLAENYTANTNFSFVHHELSRMIPENPSEEINKLVKRSSGNLANFRKDRIGLLTSFHMDSEVFYRIVQKMGVKIQKQPVDKNRYTRLEREALSYSKKDFAVKREGRGWMKHRMEMFPELPDVFRLIPQRRKLLFPSMEYEPLEDLVEDMPANSLTPKERAMELFPEVYRKILASQGGKNQKDVIKLASVEVYKQIPELTPAEMCLINSIGIRANITLKGKANLEQLINN